MQGALDTRAKLASPARKEDEERDEKSSQKLIGRLDRPHQQLFQQHRPDPDIGPLAGQQQPPRLRTIPIVPKDLGSACWHSPTRLSGGVTSTCTSMAST